MPRLWLTQSTILSSSRGKGTSGGCAPEAAARCASSCGPAACAGRRGGAGGGGGGGRGRGGGRAGGGAGGGGGGAGGGGGGGGGGGVSARRACAGCVLGAGAAGPALPLPCSLHAAPGQRAVRPRAGWRARRRRCPAGTVPPRARAAARGSGRRAASPPLRMRRPRARSLRTPQLQSLRTLQLRSLQTLPLRLLRSRRGGGALRQRRGGAQRGAAQRRRRQRRGAAGARGAGGRGACEIATGGPRDRCGPNGRGSRFNPPTGPSVRLTPPGLPACGSASPPAPGRADTHIPPAFITPSRTRSLHPTPHPHPCPRDTHPRGRAAPRTASPCAQQAT
jgi:hypothetical protein